MAKDARRKKLEKQALENRVNNSKNIVKPANKEVLRLKYKIAKIFAVIFIISLILASVASFINA